MTVRCDSRRARFPVWRSCRD